MINVISVSDVQIILNLDKTYQFDMCESQSVKKLSKHDTGGFSDCVTRRILKIYYKDLDNSKIIDKS